MIESELFGHTKGAFTGATLDKTGLISRAEGGSLLLDEIAEMPVELQPKLLRVLQERAYYRLGSEKAQEADFRLISSTNRDPLDAVREGRLREDLYYRVNTIEIRLPPLRERVEDIQHLAEHFLQQFVKKYQRPSCRISRSLIRAFDYSWPGHVRSFNCSGARRPALQRGNGNDRRAAVWPGGGEAMAAATQMSPRPATVIVDSTPAGADTVAPSEPEAFTFDDIGRLIVDRVPDPKTGALPVDVFGQIERAVVTAALSRTKGNKQAAASLLGLYRPRLYSLIKKHNVSTP